MTVKRYIVAYPHPDVPLSDCILQSRLDSDSGGDTVLERLHDNYPDQHDDLKDATFWKASRSAVAQLPP